MAAAVAWLLVTGCAPSSSSDAADELLNQQVPSRVVVTTRQIAGLGRVLTDGSGHAVYMFPPDAGSRVSCVGACAGTWPPLAIKDGKRPTAGGGVNQRDLSTLADPNTGARIITYTGYPLYRYAGDVSAGTANGQALFNNGGPWYVLDVDGQPITTDPQAHS
jgi:predicted lipoprotein with Yx(FWY)xxD motif